MCCVIGFLKLHLLNYEVHHCDLSFFFLYTRGKRPAGKIQGLSYAETEEGREGGRHIGGARGAEKERAGRETGRE